MAIVTIQDLSFPEQLVVWSLRRWLTDRNDWPLIRRELHRACGGVAGYAAAQAMAEIIDLMSSAGSRIIGCHRLECRSVSPDEMRLVALLAASQSGDAWLGRRIAAELVTPQCREQLAAACGVLAQAFGIAGQRLPLRSDAETRDPAATLH